MVLAHFVPLKSDKRTRAALTPIKNYSWAESRILNVSVAHIPFLGMASLWTAGIPEVYPDYECLSFEVDVDHSTMSIVSAYGRLGNGNPIIPKSHHFIPGSIANSYFAYFPMGSHISGLVIPCWEIFRFYYGRSSKLAVPFCDGSFLTNRSRFLNWNESHLDNATGDAFIKLGLYVDDLDRFELARTRFSQIALSEVESLIPRASRHQINRAFPMIIRPPFVGRTTLTVYGKRLRVGSTWTFLAFVIRSCSGEMPFRHLKFGRATSGMRNEFPDSDRASPAFQGSLRHIAELDGSEAMKLTQASDPSSRDIPYPIPGNLNRSSYLDSFTDEHLKRRPTGEYHSASKQISTLSHGETFSSGIGSATSTFRSASVVSGNELGLSEILSAFVNVINTLPLITPDIKIIDYEMYDFSTIFTPPQKQPTRWAFLGDATVLDPRRMVVFRLSIGSRMFIVAEVDRNDKSVVLSSDYFRTLISCPPEHRSLSKIEVRLFVEDISETHGVIGGKKWPNARLHDWMTNGLKHIEGESRQRRARRLASKLKQML
ncbi:MAG: hypothetical protein ACYDA1_00025 [Vulcanimicrobiaceae bacterium]